MNRITLFCIYCRKGIILSSDLHLIAELRSISSKLIVILNGECSNLSIINEYYDILIRRDNKGFDAGAYSEVLSDSQMKELIQAHDELILCNNSFFGPFIPFSQITEQMEKKETDFWGITSSEKNFAKHIQSFFIAFNSKIIHSNLLFEYFEEHIPTTLKYDEVCRVFENGLFHYLEKNNMSYSAYSQNINYDPYRNCFGSIKYDNVPVLKRKAFDKAFNNTQLSLSALKYIHNNHPIDINTILNDVNFLYNCNFTYDDLLSSKETDISPNLIQKDFDITREELFTLIEDSSGVYIYGTGGTAVDFYSTFFFYPNNPKLLGFIVSDNQCPNINATMYGYPILKYSDISGTGQTIILAVTKENNDIIISFLDDNDNIIKLWKK